MRTRAEHTTTNSADGLIVVQLAAGPPGFRKACELEVVLLLLRPLRDG